MTQNYVTLYDNVKVCIKHFSKNVIFQIISRPFLSLSRNEKDRLHCLKCVCCYSKLTNSFQILQAHSKISTLT